MPQDTRRRGLLRCTLQAQGGASSVLEAAVGHSGVCAKSIRSEGPRDLPEDNRIEYVSSRGLDDMVSLKYIIPEGRWLYTEEGVLRY